MKREKVTFEDIFQDFKIRFPNLSSKAAYWKPDGYLSIRIFFTDGAQMVYDYLVRKGVFMVLPKAV